MADTCFCFAICVWSDLGRFQDTSKRGLAESLDLLSHFSIVGDDASQGVAIENGTLGRVRETADQLLENANPSELDLVRDGNPPSLEIGATLQ